MAKAEKDVREILEETWKNPDKSEAILTEVAEKNKEVYEFEKMLEKKSDK